MPDSLRERFTELKRALLETTAPGRERALAMTKIEEAEMWADKAEPTVID